MTSADEYLNRRTMGRSDYLEAAGHSKVAEHSIQNSFCPTYPNSTQTQLWTLLEALRRGERLTVAIALEKYQCYALSQRMGDLRKLGWPILSAMIELPSGKHVAQYHMEG